MAQANSAKLSIVVRSICCSKVKNVDAEASKQTVSGDLPNPEDSLTPNRQMAGSVESLIAETRDRG